MRIVVHGGHPLNGSFRPSGNSNSAIALAAAALLTDETVTLRGVPDTLSTAATFESARALGVEVTLEDGVCRLQAGALQTRFLAEEVTDGQVSAILFLAPILARRGHARIELPPPLSRYHPHLAALRDLGVTIQASGTVLDFHVEPWDTRDITLLQASVTTTALVCMLAAALGRDTIVRNAASEPHVQDLQQMLVMMGAQIEGIGSNLIHIRGDETLGGADLTLSPDHIEIATIASIGAITHGSLHIEDVKPEHLRLIVRVLARLGVNLYLNSSTLFLPAHDALVVSQTDEELDVPIETAPWPGFPSDLVAMTTVVASQARGMTLIHEKLFSNRLLFVDKLAAMGAQIVLCDPHRALIVGPSKLRGGYMDTPDVRTGLALLGAALCAQGTVTIDSAELIDRTFENVVSRLVALGAQIEVVQA
ncbi:MAG TPA: UDP-N-acetylglucosamine 1-carboxyvinyltransferase [Aggregatilinea sp.]|jgi:UDP-N-acetylglucosamine 1-carboxyvinyltransferase|uniref:UDP-N-acetylglucosamine 1-carboxyvinyltransferase n=1 Tax=Aggregatilinea sp. TaxID=2806333 RepID=UPI002C1CC6CE|nr:UDP-N-acetylglucosamine 1-carboxyvinyltransferase [Aggregatilinea sp.]HML20801.1 UDP-N-acetylglucosamine 1-carboxyvinyltransferase [Aggregatilinea sp.]